MTRRPARVLCIDDDPELLGSLADGLGACGFEVSCAADGPKGIDAFLGQGADVVLLDLELPGMDGAGVLRALKNLAADGFLPVIFLTGRSDTATKVRLLEGGGDDFCSKPFSLEEIVARIHVLLRIRDRQQHLEKETGRFRRFALTDSLTELGNRRAFDTDLDREWARMERSGRALGLLIADIDRFKAFNDRYGHRMGDEVLKGVAASVAEAIRQGDEAFRFGGEEFAIILPDTTHPGALVVAERIRSQVARTAVGSLSVTVSVGVAVAPAPGVTTKDALVEAADRALYEAKAAGRNRVVYTGLGVLA